MAKRKVLAQVASQERLSGEIYSMWISFSEEDNIAEEAQAGQFLSLYCREGSRLLPRPISICEIDREKGRLRLVYRVAGEGTREFSTLQEGDTIEVLGPLGNGFTKKEGKSILIGGGIGIPPMLELAKALFKAGGKKEDIQVVLGYRDNDLFLKEEFAPYAEVFVSTEDGSVGTKGNVIDAVNEHQISGGEVYACGPLPMLRGVKAYAKEHHIPAQISMEERMACGIGACLVCVCMSKETDAHSHVKNKRVCKDGPVFDAEEVEL